MTRKIFKFALSKASRTTLYPGIFKAGARSVNSTKSPKVVGAEHKPQEMVDLQDLLQHFQDAATVVPKPIKVMSATATCGDTQKEKELKECGPRMVDHRFVSIPGSGVIGTRFATLSSTATLKIRARNAQLPKPDGMRATTLTTL